MIRNYKEKSFKKNHPANLPWNWLVRGVCVRQIPLLAYSASLGYMSTSLHLVAAASFFNMGARNPNSVSHACPARIL